MFPNTIRVQNTLHRGAMQEEPFTIIPVEVCVQVTSSSVRSYLKWDRNRFTTYPSTQNMVCLTRIDSRMSPSVLSLENVKPVRWSWASRVSNCVLKVLRHRCQSVTGLAVETVSLRKKRPEQVKSCKVS